MKYIGDVVVSLVVLGADCVGGPRKPPCLPYLPTALVTVSGCSDGFSAGWSPVLIDPSG